MRCWCTWRAQSAGKNCEITLDCTWVVDARRVGHGRVQEQAIHVIASVVVLLNVAPAALHGVWTPVNCQ